MSEDRTQNEKKRGESQTYNSESIEKRTQVSIRVAS
jgi:hypothetical protein